MATLATLVDIKDAISTTASDRTLRRLLDAAEEDVRAYVGTEALKEFPVVVWRGRRTLLTTPADLTLPASILGYNYVRLEGTVGTTAFTADTDELDEDGGTEALIPEDSDGDALATAAFTATIDDTGRELTLQATSTGAPIVTRVLGLATLSPMARYVQAIIDLVRTELEESTGSGELKREEIGQYEVEYFQRQVGQQRGDRASILTRLILAGEESLAF